MGKARPVETQKELYAVMVGDVGSREKKAVKTYQYYSVLDFCRGFGESEEVAKETASWCQRKARAGDFRKGNGYSIRIEEREVQGW